MRTGMLFLAFALMVALCCDQASTAECKGKKKGTTVSTGGKDTSGKGKGKAGFGKGKAGFGKGKGKAGFGAAKGGLVRVVDDMNLSSAKADKAKEAIRAYEDNVQRLTDLACAELMLKLKKILTKDEFTKVSTATEKARDGFGPRAGRGPRGGFGGRGRGLDADAMIERILSFDKNKDGKITKDELPERMQDLIAKGDTNKDGSLDRDEIKKMAPDLARQGGRGFGPGPVAAGRLTPRAVETALDDLKLTSTKKESATTAVKACKENARKLESLARGGLLLKVSEVLDAAEVKKLTEALDRLPPGGGRPPFGRGPFRRPSDQ